MTKTIEEIEKELFEKLPTEEQHDIAVLYSELITSGKPGDSYEEINTAIRKRWSAAGLNRVKKLAWDMLA